jgi:2-amino-4-hydroxy-6-hydroxymethyldihydropteridine diphosphokinase
MPADSPVTAYVALGSNLGDRAAFLATARDALQQTVGVMSLRGSAVAETVPLGGADQPPYLNQMLRLAVTLSPADLLRRCHMIERHAGRTRADRWASRTLDLDLVRYGTVLCDLPELTLPHPGLRDRTFWAHELAELESDD